MSGGIAPGREVLVPLLVGHTAWSVHLLVSYALATVGCAAEPASLPVLRHGLTAVALAVTLWGCWAVWPVAPRGAGSAGGGVDEGGQAGGDGALAGERRYARWLALALNVVFLLAIVAAGTVGAVIQPCV